MIRKGLALAIAFGGGPALGAQDLPRGAPATWPVSGALPPEARQFDFWVGEWEVNLRTFQTDLTWRDTHRATARIYPILHGKAVLELWAAPDIVGFSLRYYDTSKERWVLWLNWPGENRSGSSSLEGGFRHGRGDFYATRVDAEGNERLSRFSFNDITATSLRWDDAYSRDGGKTWTHSWIMEWTRTARIPRLGREGGKAHTFLEGDRCPAAPFRRYEFLSGRRIGTVTGERVAVPGELTGYRVLGGCAVVVFVGDGGGTPTSERFAHLTWNTTADRYELLILDDDPDDPARLYFTERGAGDLVFVERSGTESPSHRRVRLEGGPDGSVRWIEEIGRDGEWRTAWAGEFGAPR
ncbi:MAG: hypothetical protein R3266_01630 [Gemmatimonadota bacterium]|nr:hypothetical protein [Gemmatimonadota bacterium]